MDPKCNHKCPNKKGRGRFYRQPQQRKIFEDVTLWMKDGERDHEPRNTARKGKQMKFPPQPLEGGQPYWHLSFGPLKPMSDFWPPECKRVYFCCFKPPSLWSFFYSGNRKTRGVIREGCDLSWILEWLSHSAVYFEKGLGKKTEVGGPIERPVPGKQAMGME